MATYHTPARIAHSLLARAMAEAKDMLPPAVTKAQWMAAKHSPASWRSTEAWFHNQPDCDLHVLAVLTDLVLMSEALANLGSVLTEETTSGSLKLAKVKRLA